MTRLLAVWAILFVGCTADGSGGMGGGGPGGGGPGGAADGPGGEVTYNFAFRTHPVSAFSVKVDHQGLGLVTTVLLNRSDQANCQGPNNRRSLLDLGRGVARIHAMWGDDLRRLGYRTCQMQSDLLERPGVDAFDLLESIPCTRQRVYRYTPEGELIGGRTVLDIITPDFASFDVDEPGGFPNGCRPDDQITDLILAMGMVDLSEDDMTIDQVQLNPPENDVPFPNGFPYLAPRHLSLPPALQPGYEPPPEY